MMRKVLAAALLALLPTAACAGYGYGYGNKGGADALASRLEKETHVLLVFEGQKVDDALLRLLKKGTLVLTVPRPNYGAPKATPPVEEKIRPRPGGEPPKKAPPAPG